MNSGRRNYVTPASRMRNNNRKMARLNLIISRAIPSNNGIKFINDMVNQYGFKRLKQNTQIFSYPGAYNKRKEFLQKLALLKIRSRLNLLQNNLKKAKNENEKRRIKNNYRRSLNRRLSNALRTP